MSKIKITLNGEDFFCKQDQSLADLINELKLDIKKIAIEKNYEIVNSEEFESNNLNENDRVEIVYFIGGG